MTNKEIIAWIDKHRCILERLTEINTRLGTLEQTIKYLRLKKEEDEKQIRISANVLHKISRLCMKSKDPEKTLETINSLVFDTCRELRGE
jgi:hypothetical protein